MQIGPFSWSTHSPRKQWMVLGALVALVALTGVLAFTVMRVQNQQATVSRPQAAEACQTPSCCAGMATGGYDTCDFAQRAQCSPAQCDAAAGKGSRDCESGYRCSISKKACQGQNSNCNGGEDVCEEVSVPGCRCGISYSCGDGGNGGGGTTPPPTGTGGTVTVKIQSSGGGSFPTGGTVRMISTSACTSCNSACGDPVCNPNREKPYAAGSGQVTWPSSKAGSTYTFGFVGFAGTCSAPAGGSCTITVGAGVNSGGAVTVYVKDPAGSNYGSATTVRMTVTSACSACNASCTDPVCNPNREKPYSAGSGSVVWPSSRTGAQYTFALVGGVTGGCSAPAGGTCTITVGGGAATHLECVNSACKAVDGSGANKDGCTTAGASCTSPAVTHLECVNSACKKVNGSGANKDGCTTENAACLPANTHLECVSSACKAVFGAGGNQDGCTTAGASCTSNTPTDSYLTCGEDNTCRRVAGKGTSNCLSQGSPCAQVATRLTCGTDNTCQRVIGEGVSNCLSEGSACTGTPPTATYLSCGTNNTCQRVTGSGTSTCLSEGSACGTVVVTHLTCGTDNTCKRVAGAGTSTCFSEGSVCGQVNECWGNEGVDGQCYDVNGDGVINILDFSCMNNLWLADITSSSTPSCGGTTSR